ncbi:MAG: LysM peptidoglycan-binding domain-containing protein [Chloroflexota bacterium]|nr:LysM peptidoglycan-binding domain-containing protein [Chloroflexota bacterium]
MSESYKRCPICEARNHGNASTCSTCGTTIEDVEAQALSDESNLVWRDYDYRHGETDLYEGALNDTARGLFAGIAILGIALLAVIALAIVSNLSRREDAPLGELPPSAAPTRPSFATVTPGLPSPVPSPTPAPTLAPSETSTPSPCIHRVAAGDSLISIIAGCGYRRLDILPTVRAINGIVDETRIQIGQDIVVPLPSVTTGPLSAPVPQLNASASLENTPASEGLALLSFDPFAPPETPTILPGLTWHRVAAGDSMIAIAVQYDTDAKQLSDLNPEVAFALCDFSLPYGGGECIVELIEGQTLRVPAPTATITPVPTLSGSETPIPPATATVNAPFAVAPPDRAFFGAGDQITLRWVATGTLAADEIFRVVISEVGTVNRFSADTRDLFFILPRQWQADDDQRHTYTWQVSIVSQTSDASSTATDMRTLVWEGSGGSTS